MKILKTPKGHPLALEEIDIIRVQAVMEGKLDIKWVSSDELDAVRDKIFDVQAGEKQTHLGSLVVQ